MDRLGGDEALLLELCQIFLEESPKQLQKVRQAVAEADAQAVMRCPLPKRRTGISGAAGASQAAQQFEDMGHENDLSHAAETLVVLEREMASLHLALKDPSGAIQ